MNRAHYTPVDEDGFSLPSTSPNSRRTSEDAGSILGAGYEVLDGDSPFPSGLPEPTSPVIGQEDFYRILNLITLARLRNEDQYNLDEAVPPRSPNLPRRVSPPSSMRSVEVRSPYTISGRPAIQMENPWSKFYASTAPPSVACPTVARRDMSNSAGPIGDQQKPVRVVQHRAKFSGFGDCQLRSPHGFCINRHQEIVVADTENHRIVVFDMEGEIKMSFGRCGREEGFLYRPRKVTVLSRSDLIVVCDLGITPSRMQVFYPSGVYFGTVPIHFVNILAGLTSDDEDNIIFIDSVRPTIFIFNLVHKCNRFLDCKNDLVEPSDLKAFENKIYVCDFKGHSIVVFDYFGNKVLKVSTYSIAMFPNGIDVSDEGDILIGDSHGNEFHVTVFDPAGDLIGRFVCQDLSRGAAVRMSRCSGLTVTRDGGIVTLAKDNHYVLVVDTLWID